MGIVKRSIRASEDIAAATTSAAGAAAGAVAGATVGAVSGGVNGVKEGLGLGSRSVPAAALTIAAVGVAGLVDWPVLLAVGGTALVLRQLRGASAPGRAPDLPARAPAAVRRTTASTGGNHSSTSATKAAPRKATARKSTRTGPSA